MKTTSVLNTAMMFVIALSNFSCKDNNKKLPIYTQYPQQEKDSIDVCNGFPNRDDSTGKIINWESDLSSFLKDQNYFLDQIPKDYTGQIKLCDKKYMRFYLSCKNGKADGLSYEYFCKGGYKEMYFKKSLAEGTWVRYDKDKKISYVKNFKFGQLHGECIYLDKFDQLWLKETYLNGQKHGIFEEYYLSGQIKKQEEYKYNFLKNREDYYENGNIKSFEEYTNGRMTRRVAYDEFGTKISEYKEKPPLDIEIHRP